MIIIPTWDQYLGNTYTVPQIVAPYQSDSTTDNQYETSSLSGDKLTDGTLEGVIQLGTSSAGYVRLDGNQRDIIVHDDLTNIVVVGEVDDGT